MYNINNEVSSKSNIKPVISGDRIVVMTFEGVESKEIIAKKDGSKYDILTIKFSNEEGIFEDSVFEPKRGDDERKTSDAGYLSPSLVEEMLAKFRHLIAAVNPELDTQIENKTKTLAAPNWKALRTLMEKATNKGKGVQVQLKLMSDKEGKGVFPRFFLGLSKAEKAYMRTNFIAPIGVPLAFTDKEKERMLLVSTAKPTPMPKQTTLDDMEDVSSPSADDGLDFNLEDL